jgi:hypothetical protein
MTEFTHEPFDKMIIKNLVHENLENFLYECYVNHFKEVFWVDGMMLLTRKFIFGAGEKEYDNMVKGTRYFEKLTFVKLPKYVQSLKWKEGGSYDLRLLNYNNDSKFREIAKWIKTQPIWNTEPEKEELK